MLLWRWGPRQLVMAASRMPIVSSYRDISGWTNVRYAAHSRTDSLVPSTFAAPTDAAIRALRSYQRVGASRRGPLGNSNARHALPNRLGVHAPRRFLIHGCSRISSDELLVIPSEGAKRRSRGIAIVRAERLSVGIPAIPRLAALARNDRRSRYSIDPSASANRWCDSVSGGT